MKKCKYCKSDIDSKAKVCPNCLKKQGIPKWALIIIIVFIIIIIGSISNSDNASEGNVSNNQEKPIEKFTYEITNQYMDDLGLGYYIEGSLKNNKNRDYSYVQIEFVCYDASGNNLGTAMDNTNNLLGNQTWKFKAMALFGDVENVDHCDYHDVTAW